MSDFNNYEYLRLLADGDRNDCDMDLVRSLAREVMELRWMLYHAFEQVEHGEDNGHLWMERAVFISDDLPDQE